MYCMCQCSQLFLKKHTCFSSKFCGLLTSKTLKWLFSVFLFVCCLILLFRLFYILCWALLWRYIKFPRPCVSGELSPWGFRMVAVVTCVSLLQMAQSTAAAEEGGYCSMTTDVCVSFAMLPADSQGIWVPPSQKYVELLCFIYSSICFLFN